MDCRQPAEGGIRKRKADTKDANERLRKVSKRLSQLNLGRNGHKLNIATVTEGTPFTSTIAKAPTKLPANDEQMRLDDTPNKVFIYNLDDELSESDSEEGKVIFLPGFEKRLRETRIPRSILANKDGELAGRNLRNELVLYKVPASLTVPEERDSVRKAIIESRARAQDKHLEHGAALATAPDLTNGYAVKTAPIDAPYVPNGTPICAHDGVVGNIPNSFATTEPPIVDMTEDDPDAMDLS